MPEMQALAERIEAAFAAKQLRALTPFAFMALKTVAPAPDSLIGQTLVSVGRRGKFLIAEFENARMLIHLSQGGRVDFEQPAKKTKPKGATLRLVFDDDGVLIKEFGTERKASWWVLGPGGEGPLAKLGPEPFDDAFAEWVSHSDDARRIHTALRDQRTVAGIGRGHSDDILHRARLSPYATMMSLDDEGRRGLMEAVHEILTEALAGERARTGGLPPKLSDRFRVHGRAGTPCPECGADLRRVSYDSHEVVYCPGCQTEGKVLADRRMSRLIR